MIELAAIVALDGLDRGAKLCAHISKKVKKSGKSVRLKAKRKCPNIMSTIVKNNKIIFVTGHTNNRGCPKITVYQIKIMKSSRAR